MPGHSAHFESTPGSLVLTSAILLYQSEGRSNASAMPARGATAFASLHAVDHHEGEPVIGAGTALSRAHLRQWAEALGRAAAPEILPDKVLVAHPDVLAWWCPEQVRAGYFNLTRPPAGAKALSEQTVVPVPYPAHLFVATRAHLGVYALPANCRPDADTAVLHSPILNVYLSGRLCWGNIVRPKALSTATIPEYEAAVFDSWSTHPNAGQEQTVSSKGGLVRLWDDLAARKAQRFPVKRLRPFNPSERRQPLAEPITLRRLIAGSVR